MNDTQRTIEQALSLRAPQKESLDILVQILNKIVLSKEMPGTVLDLFIVASFPVWDYTLRNESKALS